MADMIDSLKDVYSKTKIKNRLFAKKKFPIIKSSFKYHIHFGAGNIGLGVVVRKFLKRRIIIIQRPGDKWNTLKKFPTIKLYLNELEYKEIFFIHHDSSNFYSSLEEKLKSGGSFFICTNNSKIIKQLLKNAESISTSLKNDGLKEIINLLNSFPNSGHPLNLYPFENDISSLDSLKPGKFNIIYTTVDKICIERIIRDNTIRIDAEIYELVYLLDQYKKVGNEISNENVIITENKDEYDFYHNRKLYIVNGIHMIAALLSYNFLMKRNIPIDLWGPYHLATLMGINEIKNPLNVFVKILSLKLISETDFTTLTKIYSTVDKNFIYKELLSFGRSTIDDRFNYSLDHLGRILDINKEGVNNFGTKVKVRIHSISDYIKSEIFNNIMIEMNSEESKSDEFKNELITLGQSINNILFEITKSLV
jgi:hypothetical protein